MKVILYTDGGARGNPGPAALGCVIENENGETIRQLGKYIGENTNNVAEYMAVIQGLALCEELSADEVDVFSDSQLLVKQLNGEYRVRAEHLRPLYEQVRTAEAAFNRVSFTHVRRSHPGTTRADALVNQALDETAQEMKQ